MSLQDRQTRQFQILSKVLLTLLLLAFLCHTALARTCATYQAVWRELGTRRTFFNDLRTLTRYFYFADWHSLLMFMAQQLDLPPTAALSQETVDLLTLLYAA